MSAIVVADLPSVPQHTKDAYYAAMGTSAEMIKGAYNLTGMARAVGTVTAAVHDRLLEQVRAQLQDVLEAEDAEVGDDAQDEQEPEEEEEEGAPAAELEALVQGPEEEEEEEVAQEEEEEEEEEGGGGGDGDAQEEAEGVVKEESEAEDEDAEEELSAGLGGGTAGLGGGRTEAGTAPVPKVPRPPLGLGLPQRPPAPGNFLGRILLNLKGGWDRGHGEEPASKKARETE